MKSKYANIVIIFVIMVVCTLSMVHDAFGNELSISDLEEIEKVIEATLKRKRVERKL